MREVGRGADTRSAKGVPAERYFRGTIGGAALMAVFKQKNASDS